MTYLVQGIWTLSLFRKNLNNFLKIAKLRLCSILRLKLYLNERWIDSKSERWRYIWNQNGTLKEVRPPGGGDFAFDALFTYDALGRRLSKDAIGITCWLWNGNVPLHEWTPSQRRNEQGEIEEIYKSYQDNKPVNIKKCLNHQHSF